MLPRTQEIESDLTWWSDTRYLLAGVSLVHVQPDLLFWSNTSDQSWGANLLDGFVSGHWSLEEQGLSINLRELQAIRLGLQHFCQALMGYFQTVPPHWLTFGSRGAHCHLL